MSSILLAITCLIIGLGLFPIVLFIWCRHMFVEELDNTVYLYIETIYKILWHLAMRPKDFIMRYNNSTLDGSKVGNWTPRDF